MNTTNDPIVVEEVFGTSIENVWNAITMRDKMIQWYFPNIPSFKPVVGFKTQFMIHVEDRRFLHQWKLTEVIPIKKISYEWRFKGYLGIGVSIFELTETRHQTKLKFTFSVIKSFPNDILEFKRESGVIGWNYLIKENLKKYLEEKRTEIK